MIYRSHYGAFLQPFQFELQQKRITGHPASVNAQGHELLLRIVLSAHQRVFSHKWLASCDISFFRVVDGETRAQTIDRVRQSKKVYFEQWLEGLDEPSLVSALFMKYMASYLRCVNGVRKGNSWLMEIESLHWLGVHKLSGKHFCSNKTCH